jgi:peptidyl-prolyl cis-trans isomerase A (cyclophilin A)
MKMVRQNTIYNRLHRLLAIISLLAALLPAKLWADTTSARAAMEDSSNPLLLVSTTAGNIYLELFPDEAPSNVANIQALIEGEVEIVDFENRQVFTPRFYDGMRFHRVIPELLIQTGSPYSNVFGGPETYLPDEINANSLGLDRMPVVMPDGSFNSILQLSNREAIEQKILLPLYRAMGIDSNEEINQQQFEINQRLRSMSVKQAFENLGYRYTERFLTRSITRGTVAMANSGPNTNGSEFFISLTESAWWNGRYTVIGQVVEGMETVEQINNIAVDTLDPPTTGTLIYSIRQL